MFDLNYSCIPAVLPFTKKDLYRNEVQNFYNKQSSLTNLVLNSKELFNFQTPDPQTKVSLLTNEQKTGIIGQ